mgnify:FL=1
MIEIKKDEKKQVADLAEQIYQVLKDVYAVSPWNIEQIEKDLQNPLSVYVLALEAKNLIGFLAFQESDFEAEVLQIAVKKAYQGKKIATALFEYLPIEKEIFLEVRESNKAALLFYQKEKFIKIARRKNYYHEPVEDANEKGKQ